MSERLPLLLKRGLLFFWAAWLSVVFLSNVVDGCKGLGLLDANWRFASGNYFLVLETTARYGTPAWLSALLFLGVVAWEGTAAGLFWMAALRYRGKGGGRPVLYAAFLVSLGLWCAFALADEVFIAYRVEGTHLGLFVAQLVTLTAVELLPDRTAVDPG